MLTEIKIENDEEMIQAAKEFYDDVKSGKIIGYAMIYYNSNGTINHQFSQLKNRYDTAGFLEELKLQVLKHED